MLYKRKLAFSILFAIAGYGAWVAVSDAGDVFNSAIRVGAFGLVYICIMSVLNYALRFARWHWYFRRMGHNLAVWEHLRIYLAGFALTTTPGKAGEAIRSLFLKEHGVPYTASLAALAAERIADVISIALIAAVGIVLVDQFRWLAILMLLGAVILIVSLHSNKMHILLHRLMMKMPNGRLQGLADRVIVMLGRISQIMSARNLVLSVAIGIVAWGAEAYGFWFLVNALGYELPLLVAAAVYALGMLAGAISFMPGGLGGAEAAMAVMLVGLGFSGPDAVSATLICRLATLWLAVAIGFVALGTLSPISWQSLTSTAEDGQ